MNETLYQTILEYTQCAKKQREAKHEAFEVFSKRRDLLRLADYDVASIDEGVLVGAIREARELLDKETSLANRERDLFNERIRLHAKLKKEMDTAGYDNETAFFVRRDEMHLIENGVPVAVFTDEKESK